MLSPPASSAVADAVRPPVAVQTEAVTPRPTGTLYFAYGSNMHLAQMTQRCPRSVFKGRAMLDSHRWQINERGVANVIKSAPYHSVEGLLYRISPEDEESLDLSEGVSQGFYQKQSLTVIFEPHKEFTDMKTSRVRLLMEERSATDIQGPQLFDHIDGSQHTQAATALVYVSEYYSLYGPIRQEYIARMQNAVNDAVALGVSRQFVDKYIVPFLDPKKIRHLNPEGVKPSAVDEDEHVNKRLKVANPDVQSLPKFDGHDS